MRALEEHFPLGRPVGVVAGDESGPSNEVTRPFGLRHVSLRPVDALATEPTDAHYCPDRQVNVMRGGEPLVAGTRHAQVSSITTTKDSQSQTDTQTDWSTD